MILRRISAASLVRSLGVWRSDGAGGSTYRRLAERVRLLILDGRLPLEVTLPGERELAAALMVSRTTVTAAFRQLRDEGFLDSRQGAGARTRLPQEPAQRREGLLAHGDNPEAIDLASAAMPAFEVVHQAYAKALAQLPAHLPSHGYEPTGLPALRAIIAQRYTDRGLPTTPDQILVTNGAQHAVALLLRLTTGPGDRVLIDHPTYPHAIDAILRAAAEMEQHHADRASNEQADRNFHLAIARATGNTALVGVVETLWNQRGSMWHKLKEHFQTEDLRQNTLNDHRNIVSAIAAHDAAGARQAMRAHLERVTKTFSRG